MRRIKRMMAVLMLAAVATISAQTAFAGVILSDQHRDGVLVSDRQDTKVSGDAWDIAVVIVSSLTGVLVGD
jgi:hypothetical protein